MHPIPPTIDPQTPSEGEQLIFEHLAADEAHPEWTVLHSQDIARRDGALHSSASDWLRPCQRHPANGPNVNGTGPL